MVSNHINLRYLMLLLRPKLLTQSQIRDGEFDSSVVSQIDEINVKNIPLHYCQLPFTVYYL